MSVDWSKPIQTRDGRKARFLGTLDGVDYGHLSAVWSDKCQSEMLIETTKSGYVFEYSESKDDIINSPPPPKYFWVKVYEGPDYYFVSSAENTVHGPDEKHIATLKININEIRGKFDE